MLYKEFKSGVVSRDAETGVYTGVVENTSDFVNFSADSFLDLEKAFHDAVDDYLEMCKEVGKDPYEHMKAREK